MKRILINDGCIKKFETAIEFELSHFYMYKSLANKMQELGYFGAKDYYLTESAEEETHYQKHIDFLNDVGVLPKLPSITVDSNVMQSLKDSVIIAYENELDLLKYYRDMYREEAMEYPEIASYLNFFLDTQREAVGFYGDILSMFDIEASNPNINMVIDHKFKKLAK